MWKFAFIILFKANRVEAIWLIKICLYSFNSWILNYVQWHFPLLLTADLYSNIFLCRPRCQRLNFNFLWICQQKISAVSPATKQAFVQPSGFKIFTGRQAFSNQCFPPDIQYVKYKSTLCVQRGPSYVDTDLHVSWVKTFAKQLFTFGRRNIYVNIDLSEICLFISS